MARTSDTMLNRSGESRHTCLIPDLSGKAFSFCPLSMTLAVDLNISCDTIKILEENIGRKISDILHSNIFTNMSPRARDIKERINKWDYIKLKSFCTGKENTSKMKREPTI